MTEKERLQLEEMMIKTDHVINQQAAKDLYAMYTQYINAGFTEAQSFSLIKGILEAIITAAMYKRNEQ